MARVATATPDWAAAAPVPWQSRSWELSRSLPLSSAPPIDVTVPIDNEWHRLPVRPAKGAAASTAEAQGGGLKSAKPGSAMSEVAARRAARRARESRNAAKRDLASTLGSDGGGGTLGGHEHQPVGADAVWTARKERIQGLLADENASASSLKRELRMLLGFADATRRVACEERALLAAELQRMAGPLVLELRRLKTRLPGREGARAKPAVVVAAEGFQEAGVRRASRSEKR